MANQQLRNHRHGFISSITRVCLLLAVTVSFAVPGYAQERTISGVITDGGGNLL